MTGTGCILNIHPIMGFAAVGNGSSLSFPMPVPGGIGEGHVCFQWIAFGTTGAVSSGLDVNLRK